jgi:regulator of sigma E protease
MSEILARLQTPLAFLFVLGVLIFVHELGHFLVARWYGVRVLTFSLGFGPKLIRVRRNGTEYCVCALPLGGYVKLAGETVQDENRTGQPDEFLSKSKWIRFQVYLAGPVMNLLLAWVVLGGVLTRAADLPSYPMEPPLIGTVTADSPAARAGLQPGDLIVSINGRPTPTWESVDMAVLPKAEREIRLLITRGAQQLTIPITPEATGRYEVGTIGIYPRYRPTAVIVHPNTPAARGGLQRGDVVLAVDGTGPLDQPEIIKRIREAAGRTIVFTVERDGQPVDLPLVPEGSVGSATLGVTLSPYEVRRVDLGIIDAFKLSAQRNWENAKLIGATLRDLVTREQPVKQLMGPLSIASLSGGAAQLGWIPLFELLAMISLNLGLLNLLPVPVLDGGHIAILAVEGLFRRELSLKVKERILMAGAALIVLLMVTVIYNDVARLLR